MDEELHNYFPGPCLTFYLDEKKQNKRPEQDLLGYDLGYVENILINFRTVS